MIRAMLAHDDRGGIALGGTLPWPTVPRDWQWFEQHTRDGVIIMGGTTWRDSHMPRPYPQRTNCVVTRNPKSIQGADHVITADPVEGILSLEQLYPNRTLWITGGADLLNQTLHICEELWLSTIPGEWQSDTRLDLERIHREFVVIHTKTHPDVTFRRFAARSHRTEEI